MNKKQICQSLINQLSQGYESYSTQNFDGDAAIFPVISRANHSCVPNADFVTRGERRVQEIIATSNIASGEEITLCYLQAASEGSEGKKERQGYTRLWYIFSLFLLI